jgi:hypothetical protein
MSLLGALARNIAIAQTCDARFIIAGGYLEAFKYSDTVERGSRSLTLHSQHLPLESYFLAFEEAGLLVEALREPRIPDHANVLDRSRRWQRLPLFLHLRARRRDLSLGRSWVKSMPQLRAP